MPNTTPTAPTLDALRRAIEEDCDRLAEALADPQTFPAELRGMRQSRARLLDALHTLTCYGEAWEEAATDTADEPIPYAITGRGRRAVDPAARRRAAQLLAA